MVDADGAHLRKVTDDALDKGSLAWSPDGTKVAFNGSIDRDGDGVDEHGVYVMDADGSGARKIADGDSPSWSPDGGRLALACGPFREGAICTANPDGSNQQKIVTDRFKDDPNVEFVRDGDPAWSPDGSKIAFTRLTELENLSAWNVYTMSLDGSGLKQVPKRYLYAIGPDWGPAPGTRPSPGGPPETTIFSGPSGLAGPSTIFDFVASRPGTSFECALDGADFAPCEGPARYEDLADGEHEFAVRATAAGGADPTPAVRSFAVDRRTPRGGVAIDGGRARTRDRSVTLALRAADPAPGSGVSQMRLRNGAGQWRAWRPYAGRTSWGLSPREGTKTVYAQYRDRAGNVSPVARDSISYRR